VITGTVEVAAICPTISVSSAFSTHGNAFDSRRTARASVAAAAQASMCVPRLALFVVIACGYPAVMTLG